MSLNTLPSVAIEPDAVSAIAVSRLTLTDFRCFAKATLSVDARPVVLTGPNGAGKTSVLEALSLLTPGPGLRGARLADIARRASIEGEAAEGAATEGAGWAVAAEVEGFQGPARIGTGAAPGEARRAVRIDGRPAKGQAALAEVISALWLTPSMDRMFNDGAGARRRFFDRLVFGFDAGHASRLSAYERALRERARLLRDGAGAADPAWLGALESRMAENGVAVAAARRTTVRALAADLAHGAGPFPGAIVGFDGGVEALLDDMPALDAEAHIAAALAASRGHDARAGGASQGPHRSDLAVRHKASGAPAAQCSSGEQKALLIAIVLATARLQARLRGVAPLLLLDEVAAHLDADHRCALADEIAGLGVQAWLTGTDRAAFAAFAGRAQYVTVEAATVTVAGTVK